MIKICECGERNPPGALYCAQCKEDISRLRPVEEPPPGTEAVAEIDQAQAAGQSAAPAETHNRPRDEAALTLLAESGLEIGKAGDGDIIGRAGVGSDYLIKFPTVARKHIQVFRQNGAWRLKNLSDNGTFLNGREVPQNGEREMNMGDELKLSTRCRLTVFW
jgi:pSer/pThr/pTyr-binding forkhead associated (FHA) protein